VSLTPPSPSLALRALAGLLLIAALGLFSAGARAQDYPSKPLTLVVPYPPGGVSDTVGRPVAEAMSRHLRQTVVIDNRVGASGAIGMAQVAKARPDGYTVLMALSSLVVLPEADKALQRQPLFQINQLRPIARFTADPTVLVVRADSPWKTYADFMAHVKANPGRVSFGSSGAYSALHVPMEQLKAATSTAMLHVPYAGAGPALVGLMAGQIDALATGPSTVVPLIAAGRLRPLAHWGEGRLASLPEVPSLRELKVPIQYSQWTGLFVPAGTPPEVVDKLREAARFASQDARAIAALAAVGTAFQYQDAPEFERFLQADAKDMSALIARIARQP
jgi:tripartite-type tricarboxylate transporter receptor subunit TctC